MTVEDEVREQRDGRHRLRVAVDRRVEECAVPLFASADASKRAVEDVEPAREQQEQAAWERIPEPTSTAEPAQMSRPTIVRTFGVKPRARSAGTTCRAPDLTQP